MRACRGARSRAPEPQNTSLAQGGTAERLAQSCTPAPAYPRAPVGRGRRSPMALSKLLSAEEQGIVEVVQLCNVSTEIAVSSSALIVP